MTVKTSGAKSLKSATTSDSATALHDSLLDYLKNPQAGIIQPWFRNRGSVYHFVFRKNLRVTNIQYSELISLLRQNVTRDGQNIGNEILFFKVNDFIATFQGLVEPFKQPDPEKTATVLIKQYHNLMRNSIIVDSLFGSCCVFLPPGISLDLGKVVAYAGYIAFAGRNIYTRNVLKADKREFMLSLKDYVRKHPATNGQKRLFAVYAHEDFSDADRELHSDLSNGLEELKIYVEKNYMKNDSLIEVIRSIDSDRELAKHLLIPGAGDCRKTHPKVRMAANCYQASTVWLMSDRSVNPRSPQHPGNDRYYFCFDQMFINRNQFYLFDENKPAWKASTTIPHTLIAAMLNIGVTNLKEDRKTVHIADPFSGTGTTLFESIKYSDCKVSTSDLDPLTTILINDNAKFFALKKEDVQKLCQMLLDSCKEGGSSLEKLIQVYRKCDGLFSAIAGGEIVATESDVDTLNSMTYNDRLRFYFLLRTHINAIPSIETERLEFFTAYKIEVVKFVRTLTRYIELLDRVSSRRKHAVHKGKFMHFVDKYSTAVMVHPKAIADTVQRLKEKQFKHEIRGVSKLPSDQYHLIVTDPPYGFNATSDISELASLYDDAIMKMLKSTESDAQILIALPDRSYSGKTSPVFTHKEVVIQQFLTKAQDHELKREILSNVQSIPLPEIYRPPYYWESAKALRRSIVHLRIKRRAT